MDTDMMWIAFEGVWSFIWGENLQFAEWVWGKKTTTLVGLGWVG